MLESFKQKLKSKLGVPSVNDGLKSISRNGFKPKVIYDIGAFQGTWTKEVLNIFPDACFFMFEAQESKRIFLEEMRKKNPSNLKYHIALLGATSSKEVIFHEYETASSVLDEFFETGAKAEKKKLQRLDEVIEMFNWPLPDLIKLDTQGYELEILKGGSKALESSEAILMEVSFIDIYKDAPLVEDVIAQMSFWGFQVYDICSLIRRPLDKALYQADLLFIKKDSKLLSNKRWA